jgi:uncharacterized protein (TIGR04255 family)
MLEASLHLRAEPQKNAKRRTRCGLYSRIGDGRIFRKASGASDRTPVCASYPAHPHMTFPHEHIVDFERPPVAEVALAVEFGEPVLDATSTLSSFWPKIARDYPRVEPQPLLPTMEESFEIPAQGTVISFQVLGGPESARYFLVSDTGNDLIQVQSSRFGYNWRKERSEAEYPRYGHVRERFKVGYEAYLETALGLQKSPRPTWCEISYVNPMLAAVGGPRPELSTLIARLSPEKLSALPQPYNTSLSERFQLQRDGEPYARFYMDVESTVQMPERRLGYTITLTMRGRVPSPDLNGVLAFFDEGRSTIVQTFRDMTTPERHEEWGKR